MWKLIMVAVLVGALAVPALAADQNVKGRDTVSAISAQAGQAAPTIVAQVREVNFVYPPTSTCPSGTLFEADFPLLSPQGDQLGTGTSCVQGWADGPCPDPAPPGCRQTTLAIFVLSFPSGSVTADMTLDERWVGNDGVVEHGTGTITGGTGAFAAATGSIDYDGILRFNGLVRFTFLVRIN